MTLVTECDMILKITSVLENWLLRTITQSTLINLTVVTGFTELTILKSKFTLLTAEYMI